MKKSLVIVIILILLLISIMFILKSKDKKNKDTFPYLFDENCEIIESDVKKGMTIKDSFSNEWVWIEVPKSEVFLTAKNEDDLEAIESDIKEYIKDYREEGYEDLNINKDSLKSIYNYGGFWISRYEIGTENVRNQDDKLIDEPLSKPNKYVYNYVDLNQAKELSSKISDGKYNTSILYGFEWDLVCKFIEKNGYTLDGKKISEEMINSNSSLWGNYYSSSFTINRGKYSINYGENYIDSKNNEQKKSYRTYLFTTGASEQNKVLNIYDFAGNVSEWTLESFTDNENESVIRDGSFYFNYGGNDPVNGRYNLSTSSNGNNYGLRICLIK